MTSTTFRVEVKAHGRVNLPRELRQAMQLSEGDLMIFRVGENGRAEVVSAAQAAKEAQGLFSHRTGNKNLADELIAERRREAALEDAR